MRVISEQDLEALAIGAGILGTGGGGNPYYGKIHAQRLLKQGAMLTVVSPDEVDDDALITSVGFMGAPVVSVERIKRGDEPLIAMRALEKHIGSTFDYIVPGEIGGSNSTAPMVVGAQAGIPVVDGDGMGRAFPELQMGTFSIYGIPATRGRSPIRAVTSPFFDGFADAEVLERYARSVTIGMGGSAGYAFPVMSGRELKRTVVRNTISLAINIGQGVIAARQSLSDPVEAVLNVAAGERLYAGKIADVERRLVGGFARGTVVLDGTGNDAGRRLLIDFQNENLVARTADGEVLAVVPDLICLVDTDTAEPITTELLRYGIRVQVLGIPAPVQLKTPEALQVIGPAAFGYHDVDNVPMAGVFGAARETVADR